jgi:hypothetical protein
MKSCGCTQHKVISFSGFVTESILHVGNFTQETLPPRKVSSVLIELETAWTLIWSGGFEKRKSLCSVANLNIIPMMPSP